MAVDIFKTQDHFQFFTELQIKTYNQQFLCTNHEIYIGYIIWHCNCFPSFFESGVEFTSGLSYEALKNSTCSDERLDCAIEKMKNISVENMTKTHDQNLSEYLKGVEKTTNMTIPKPTGIQCLPACEVQENPSQISFAMYPQKENFFHQKRFCHVASHIWQVSCQVWQFRMWSFKIVLAPKIRWSFGF